MKIATADPSSAPIKCVEGFYSPKATPHRASLVTYVKPKRKSRYIIRMRPGQKDPRLSPGALSYSGITTLCTPQTPGDNSSSADDNPGSTSTLNEIVFPGNPSAVSLQLPECNTSIPNTSADNSTDTSTDTVTDKCTPYIRRGVEPQYLEAGESLCDGKQEMFMLSRGLWQQHRMRLASVLLLLTLLAVSFVVVTVMVSGTGGAG